MNDAVIRLGAVTIFGFGILAVFSYLWGSFVFYKKAVESHFDEHSVLDGVVLSALWALIVGRSTFVVFNIATFWNHFPRIFLLTDYPGVDRWGVILGIVLGIFLTVRRIKVRFFDWFDYVSLGVTAGMSVFYAGLTLLSRSWQYFVLSVILLIIFGVFWRMEDRYRTFSWYRSRKTSARSGFIGGSLVSVWGLISLMEMILYLNFSWIALLWDLSLFVGGLVLVYIRSGRTVNEDIKIILKYGKK